MSAWDLFWPPVFLYHAPTYDPGTLAVGGGVWLFGRLFF